MIYDESKPIKVEEWPIGSAPKEVEQRISGIVLAGYEAARLYWIPQADQGRLVYRYIRANFFDEATLDEMDAEGKIPIEISEGWPKLLAELGMAKGSMKVGKPMAQAPEDALDAEGVNILLNALRVKSRLEENKLEAYKENLITGMPKFIWLEKPSNPTGGQLVSVDSDPWDCTLGDPNSRMGAFEDGELIYRIRYPSKDDLLGMFPDRHEVIEEAFQNMAYTPEQLLSYGMTIQDRDLIYSAIQAAQNTSQRTGRIHLIQRHALIKKPMELWTHPGTDAFTFVEPEKLDDWKAANPGAKMVKAMAKIHWVTSCLATGQLLDNRPHWFQDQRFNCEVLNLMMLDNRPVSVLGFAAANWYLAAIAKTEHIHQLRLNSGNPVVVQEGGIKNMDNLEYETSRPRGKIIANRGKDVRSVITPLQANRPTQEWNHLYQETRETNDRLTVDPNIEGGSQSSQESAKVVAMRVAQATNTKYAQILDNANDFYLRLDNLMVRVAQRLAGKDYLSFSWLDPRSQEEKKVEINVPQMDENVLLGGEPRKFLNRFDLTDYQVVMAEKDNSMTGRAAELAEAMEIMEALGSRVPPEELGELLVSLPNTICQRMGNALIERAKAMAQKKPEPDEKVQMVFQADKLAYNPTMQAAAAQLLGLQFPPQAQQAPPGQPGQPAPDQTSAPQGAPPPAEPGPGVSAPAPLQQESING